MSDQNRVARRSRTESSDAALHYRAMSRDKPSKEDHLPLASGPSSSGPAAEDAAGDAAKLKMLVGSFVAMIFVGLGNKIFQKLQTIPM